jgi:hypothetical protein
MYDHFFDHVLAIVPVPKKSAWSTYRILSRVGEELLHDIVAEEDGMPCSASHAWVAIANRAYVSWLALCSRAVAFHCLITRRLKTGERRSCSGHLLAFVHMLEAISTYNETLKPAFEQLVADTNALWMLDRRQRVLHHVLDVQRCPYLMKHRAHVANARVGEHDELELRRRFEVMHLVLARAIRQERVVISTQLTDNAAQ